MGEMEGTLERKERAGARRPSKTIKGKPRTSRSVDAPWEGLQTTCSMRTIIKFAKRGKIGRDEDGLAPLDGSGFADRSSKVQSARRWGGMT